MALLGHGSVDTFPHKRDAHNSTVTMETGMFSFGCTLRLYSEDPRPAQCSSVEWSEVVGDWESSVVNSVEGWQLRRALQGRLRRDGAIMSWQLTGVQLRDIRPILTTWVREAEESQLLESVARKRLLKTQQAGKKLNGCYGDPWIVEISSGAEITCSSEWCI
jgi:hypothetical protein